MNVTYTSDDLWAMIDEIARLKDAAVAARGTPGYDEACGRLDRAWVVYDAAKSIWSYDNAQAA